ERLDQLDRELRAKPRERNPGEAAPATEVHETRRLVELAGERERVGEMLLDQHGDRSRCGQVDARVPAKQRLGVSSERRDLLFVAGGVPRRSQRAHQLVRASVGWCLCREHRVARIITRAWDGRRSCKLTTPFW